MPHIVGAFARCEEGDGRGEQRAHLVEVARSGCAEEGFQLREGLFDGIEVGTIGRKESELRAGAFDGRADFRLFVDRQVVEHDDVPAPQGRDQDLFDVRPERWTVDRPIEDRGGGQAVEPQAYDDGVRLPLAAGRVILKPRAAGAASIATQEIRRDPTFIEKDVLGDIPEWLRVPPLPARRGHVRTALFVGVYRFF